jgi:hypothetical protein
MRWSRYFAVIFSIAIIAFPYNIIGCAGSDDPYDFYTSFFDSRLGNSKELKPFYYTYNFLYDYEEPVDQWATTAKDWKEYCGVSATDKEARDLTGNYTLAELQSLYTEAEKGTTTALADSVRKNVLAQQLLKTNDLEALGYLIYLKKIQSFVIVEDAWNAPPRDSVKMAAWAKNGEVLYIAAKKPFFRQRYAYQVMRLSHYNNNPDIALLWYDKASKAKTSASIQELCDALRAGALYRKGDKTQAAYHFCQLFAEGKLKKISNYYGYHVYTNNIPTASILAYCTTDRERANVLATISMGNPALDLPTLKSISRLSPGDPVLNMLAVREINKLEEKYLSPAIPSGSMYFQYNLYYADEGRKDSTTEKQVLETAEWMGWMANQKSTTSAGLYATGAAYLQYMVKDYAKSRQWLATALKKGVKGEVADQWRLTELLVTINEQDLINKDFEEKLLPSIQWLEKKALADKTNLGYYDDGPWTRFYRNLFNSVIVPRYEKQGDTHKAVLAVGTAESISAAADNGYSYYALSQARENLGSADALRLDKLINDKSVNSFEKYLIDHSTIRTNDVRDIIGTAYLREDKLAEASTWFAKVEPTYYKEEPFATYLAANPFADLILDTHAQTKHDTVIYTKLSYTKRMMSLKNQFNQTMDPNKKAMLAYELAKGYYHMTYWGNSWMLVAYYWSGSEGAWRQENIRDWQKDYYEAQKAQDWYQKTFDLSTDKEVKARALFMIAKCVQKKDKPTYSSYKDYDDYDKAMSSYDLSTRNNPVFRKLKVEYGGTKFYKQALNTCSYLKDFNSGKTKIPSY